MSQSEVELLKEFLCGMVEDLKKETSDIKKSISDINHKLSDLDVATRSRASTCPFRNDIMEMKISSKAKELDDKKIESRLKIWALVFTMINVIISILFNMI